jgi:hypothetical protein
MADIKAAFGSLTTISATSLTTFTASSAIFWESSAIDNSGNKYLDALVQMTLTFGASAPAGDKAVYVFAYGGLSGTFTNPITGSQGLVTATTAFACNLVQVLTLGTASEVIESMPFPIAPAFGGILPPKWGLVIKNDAGSTLLTGTLQDIKYKGVYATSA